MSKLHSMPMFWSEFFSDTQHMTAEAAKSYVFLLGHAWVRGAKLPADEGQLARLSRCSAKQWAAIRDEILPMFLLTEDGFLTQKRLAKEWAYVSAKVDKNRENGSLGGKRKSEKSLARGSEMTGKKTNDFNEGALANASETLKQPTPTPTPTPILISASEGTPPAPLPLPPRDVFDVVDAALRKIEGLSEHPVAVDPVIGPIVLLMAQGYNLKTDIVPSIKRQLGKRGSRRVSRWSFFVPGIIDDRTSANPSAPSQPLAEWEKRLAWARQNGKWAFTAWGPAPHKPGCRVPEAILKPDDGQNWTEWKVAS